MPVAGNAEPIVSLGSSDSARRVGVLLSHGMTGSPVSMRPWAQALTGAGYSVLAPLLPGHGTRWQDANKTTWSDWYAELERALGQLLEHCDQVVLGGLSMGGTLVTRMTAEYGPYGRHSIGDRLIGTILVNPSYRTDRKDAALLPFVQRFIGSFPGISGDIAKPGVSEYAYDRLPLKAAYSLSQLWEVTRADLGRITTPILLFQSSVDHVVEASSSRLLIESVASADLTHHLLARSFHVATLDYDAPYIFAESIRWIAEHARA